MDETIAASGEKAEGADEIVKNKGIGIYSDFLGMFLVGILGLIFGAVGVAVHGAKTWWSVALLIGIVTLCLGMMSFISALLAIGKGRMNVVVERVSLQDK